MKNRNRYILHKMGAFLWEMLNLLLLVIVCTLTIQSNALALQTGQSETVSGQVTDAADGEPLPGVNITVKGTSTGTSTDAEGNYELTVPTLNETLVFSFVSYQTREIPVNGRTSINVEMQQQTVLGEDVVVVGYGTQAKRSLTGSVGQLRGDELSNEGTISSADQMLQVLQGKLSGVQVVQNSGEPGGGFSIIDIRGIGSINAGSSPLYVIKDMKQRNSYRIQGAIVQKN